METKTEVPQTEKKLTLRHLPLIIQRAADLAINKICAALGVKDLAELRARLEMRAGATDEEEQEASDEDIAAVLTDADAQSPVEPVVVVTEVKAEEIKKPEEPAPEPPARAGEEEGELSIFELAAQSAQNHEAQAEEWDAKMQAAHGELNRALVERGIRINPDAEFVDQKTDYAKRAYAWLQIQMSREKMIADEAITHAEKEGWVEESSEPLYEFFRLRGLKLHTGALVKNRDIIIPDRLRQAILDSEVNNLDQLIRVAKDAGWAKPFAVRHDTSARENGASVEEILHAKVAEDDDESRGKLANRVRRGKKGRK